MYENIIIKVKFKVGYREKIRHKISRLEYFFAIIVFYNLGLFSKHSLINLFN